jgi:hypothetical protein
VSCVLGSWEFLLARTNESNNIIMDGSSQVMSMEEEREEALP